MIAAERCQVADLFDTLSDEQWSTPSLCSGWTVRHVAAHLVMPAGVPGDHFLHALAHELAHDFGIGHPTIQIETQIGEECALERDEVV